MRSFKNNLRAGFTLDLQAIGAMLASLEARALGGVHVGYIVYVLKGDGCRVILGEFRHVLGRRLLAEKRRAHGNGRRQLTQKSPPRDATYAHSLVPSCRWGLRIFGGCEVCQNAPPDRHP